MLFFDKGCIHNRRLYNGTQLQRLLYRLAWSVRGVATVLPSRWAKASSRRWRRPHRPRPRSRPVLGCLPSHFSTARTHPPPSPPPAQSPPHCLRPRFRLPPRCRHLSACAAAAASPRQEPRRHRRRCCWRPPPRGACRCPQWHRPPSACTGCPSCVGRAPSAPCRAPPSGPRPPPPFSAAACRSRSRCAGAASACRRRCSGLAVAVGTTAGASGDNAVQHIQSVGGGGVLRAKYSFSRNILFKKIFSV